MDEAAPVSAGAVQDALRQLIADATAHATTHASVAEMRRDFEALKVLIDRHLAESERHRATTERALEDLRAAFARIEAEMKRLADAKAALAAIETERTTQAVRTATISEARWKERAAILATAAGFVGLVLKELIQWARKP